MIDLISEYDIEVLEVTTSAEALADKYVVEGIIPERYRTDGVHIAITTVFALEFFASYNFQHIVKRRTIELTEAINIHEGYGRIGIYSPTEVIENDE